MFHEGDLQSGIATAIQQNKHVVCFVAGEHIQMYLSEAHNNTNIRRKTIASSL